MTTPKQIGRALLAAVLLVSAVLCAQAKTITLTKEILDLNQSWIDFGVATFRVPGPTPEDPPVQWAHNLAAGDTIEIEGHTRAQLVLARIRQGTATTPVTITNKPGTQFVISTTNTAFKKGFTLSGCEHFRLVGTPVAAVPPQTEDQPGIVIAATPADVSGVIVTQWGSSGTGYLGASDFEVAHLKIGHTGFAGVFIKCDSLTEASGFVMENVRIHHLHIHNTDGEGMYIGNSAYHNNSTDPHPIHDLHIHDNLVEDSGWDGIQVGCATVGMLIERNVIKGYGLFAPNNYQNEGMRINPGCAGIIRGNWIEGDPLDGAGMGILANPHSHSDYYNNVIVTPGENGIDISDDYAMLPDTEINLFNNTIVQPGLAGIHYRSVTAVGQAFNNLIADPGSVGFTEEYNPDFTASSNLVTATVAEVGFVLSPDESKYRLSAAATNAIDQGSTDPLLPGPASDYDGVPRPQGTRYDIGAFEYVPSAITGLITPAGYGQAGGAYCPATGTFNDQPSWDAVNGVPTGVAASPYTSTGIAYANRHWYIDFGPNWTNLRITGTWTRYMPLTTASYPGLGAMWWDNDTDAVNDGVTATGLNFCTAQGLNTGSSQPWVRDVDATATPITPQNRYLIINTGSAPAARANEFAISGYTVN